MSSDGNNVGGTLPLELSFLPELQRIVLSDQVIQGSIPKEWSQLSNLNTLIIGNNKLTGSFPDFLLQNSLLGTLYLSFNKFSGTISTLASTSLKELRFDSNGFVGSIPDDVGSLENLGKFRILSLQGCIGNT